MKFFLNYLIVLILTLNLLKCQTNSISGLLSQIEKGVSDPHSKNYPLKTLAYLTPWNKEGFTLAEKNLEKFDFISPCWFEIKPDELDGEFRMLLEGASDNEFIKRVKEKNNKIEILPRLHCGNFQGKIIDLWMNRSLDSFMRILERRLRYTKIDGFVFDCIYFYSEQKSFEQFSSKLLPKMKELIDKFNKKLIITLLSSSENSSEYLLNNYQIMKLIKSVDYINVMTYDYHQYKGNSPKMYNAPINWVKQTIENIAGNSEMILKKILLGIPFHGYVYDIKTNRQKNVIKGEDFIKYLKSKRDGLKWDKDEKEHLLESNGEVVAFPTKDFIEERLELSKKLKIGGCGIWDIANGNEYLLEPF